MAKSISYLLSLRLAQTRYALALAVATLTALSAHAATRTWDGGGTDDTWKTAANWDAAAVAGDDLVFGGTMRLTPDNDFAVDTGFAGITFDNTAGAFALGGNRMVLGGAITNNDADTQTIKLDLSLTAT